MSAPAEAGWPFLLARGRRAGYRSLLVPDFLASVPAVLTESLGATTSRGARHEELLELPAFGAVRCVYRTERLIGGGDGGRASLDEHGRPLEFLYGVAVRPQGGAGGEVGEGDLDDARGDALATYHRFLADEAGFVMERSEPRPLSGYDVAKLGQSTPHEPVLTEAQPPTSYSQAAATDPRPPALQSSRPPPLVLIGAVVACAAVALTLWLALFREGEENAEPEVVSVDLARPEVDGVLCLPGAKVVQEAEVTTDGATQVVYHWEIPENDYVSDPGRLVFEHAGTQPARKILTPPPLSLSLGQKHQTIRFVVEEPNEKTAKLGYTLTCAD